MTLGFLDYLLLALIAVAFIAAIVYMQKHKHKGCCSDCDKCNKKCNKKN